MARQYRWKEEDIVDGIGVVRLLERIETLQGGEKNDGPKNIR